MARLVLGLMTYYAVDLILAQLLKGWIPGPAGTVVSSFIKLFYLTFIFPCCFRRMERKL